jgi:hypothetical protein
MVLVPYKEKKIKDKKVKYLKVPYLAKVEFVEYKVSSSFESWDRNKLND